MKKLYFICNLHSGKAALSGSLAKIIDLFTANGYEVTVHPTQHAGDGCKKAKLACQSGAYDLIVCSGGDGTLNEIIQGCMTSGQMLPIGYIPTGSTNDFARGLGIPKHMNEAVLGIIHGHPFSCDIGKFNQKYFTYVAAFGAFTDIAYETPQQFKNVLGHAAYLLNGIAKLSKIRACRMRIEYDAVCLEGKFLLGMVTNSTSVGKLLSLSEVEWDDGVFEVMLIKKPDNLIQFQKIISCLVNLQLGTEREYFQYFRAAKIKFTTLQETDVPWTIDGEYGGCERINVIENCQKAVPLLIPETPALTD